MDGYRYSIILSCYTDNVDRPYRLMRIITDSFVLIYWDLRMRTGDVDVIGSCIRRDLFAFTYVYTTSPKKVLRDPFYSFLPAEAGRYRIRLHIMEIYHHQYIHMTYMWSCKFCLSGSVSYPVRPLSVLIHSTLWSYGISILKVRYKR